MKKVCDMSKEDREFVLRLLHITKDDFERAFQDLAKSDSLKGKRRFVSYWCELAELAFTKAEDDKDEELKDVTSSLTHHAGMSTVVELIKDLEDKEKGE